MSWNLLGLSVQNDQLPKIWRDIEKKQFAPLFGAVFLFSNSGLPAKIHNPGKAPSGRKIRGKCNKLGEFWLNGCMPK